MFWQWPLSDTFASKSTANQSRPGSGFSSRQHSVPRLPNFIARIRQTTKALRACVRLQTCLAFESNAPLTTLRMSTLRIFTSLRVVQKALDSLKDVDTKGLGWKPKVVTLLGRGQ